jgi:hypothetical protein
MKRDIITILLSVGIILNACKTEEPAAIASVNVVNVAVNAGTVKVNYLGKQISWASYTGADGTVAYGTNKVYSISNAIGDFSFPVVSSADTTKPVFNGKLNLNPGSINTLYLAGQSPTYDTLFVKESAFPSYADSVLAVRFINLVPNSGNINLTLAGTPAINEFNGITYKKQSGFKRYEATYKFPNTYFIFQVRNTDGSLLASYPFTIANLGFTRRKSATLVFRGLIGGAGANAPAISFIANY